MIVVLSCSCLWPIHWIQVFSWSLRCSWSSDDKRCSNYIWVIKSGIANSGAPLCERFDGNEVSHDLQNLWSSICTFASSCRICYTYVSNIPNSPSRLYTDQARRHIHITAWVDRYLQNDVPRKSLSLRCRYALLMIGQKRTSNYDITTNHNKYLQNGGHFVSASEC